jgi:hypothetical protein
MILLGMLNVCRSIDEDRMPGISCYIAGLRDPLVRLRLLQVGVAYALIVGLLSLVWMLVPEEAPGAAAPPAARPASSTPQARSEAPVPPVPGAAGGAPGAATVPPADGGGRGDDSTDASAGSDTERRGGAGATAQRPADHGASDGQGGLTPLHVFVVLGLLLVIVPLQLTMLFATVLVAWDGLPALKAMFFGFFAAWRNRAAIFVNLSGLFGLTFLSLLALGALVSLLALSEESVQFLLLPVILGLLPSWVSSNYVMVRDVLGAEREPDAGPGAAQT